MLGPRGTPKVHAICSSALLLDCILRYMEVGTSGRFIPSCRVSLEEAAFYFFMEWAVRLELTRLWDASYLGLLTKGLSTAELGTIASVAFSAFHPEVSHSASQTLYTVRNPAPTTDILWGGAALLSHSASNATQTEEAKSNNPQLRV
ncbi:unnamed protein product [Natator depressus]